uniref:Uncharacterized protein n=1 Tax=Panagrolaimus superbus TaxID=310955 RepID=A0A914Z3R7_9BILA
MHHTVAKSAEDLLVTESCICGTDYCNAEKPEITVAETMKCDAFVRAEVMGTKMVSRNVTCTGEYCFKAKITSEIGDMTSYITMGCASFIEDAQLAEEFNPTGCAKFESENVQVEACLQVFLHFFANIFNLKTTFLV